MPPWYCHSPQLVRRKEETLSRSRLCFERRSEHIVSERKLDRFQSEAILHSADGLNTFLPQRKEGCT